MIRRFLLFGPFKALPTAYNFQLSHNIHRLPALFSRDDISLPSRPRVDPISTALRAARNTSDALKVIGIHALHMEPEHVSLSLQTLSSLHKPKTGGEDKIANSAEFLLLCRRIKKQLPQFEVNDVMQALKAVTLFKVPHNSALTMQLLHMIKGDINSMNISQIMFLSFLLHNYKQVRNPVMDALKIALPIVFETQLKLKLDRSNVASLVEALIYCTRNEMVISRQSKDYIVDAFCGLDQLDWVTMDPRRARSIALAVCDLAVDSSSYETVFRDSIDLFTQHMASFTFSEIDVVAGAILKHMKRAPFLVHMPFFDELANTAVKQGWNLVECSILLRKLNHLSIVSRKLLDYVAEKIMDDPEAYKDGKFGLVKTFVTGMSVANYRTDHWNLLKDLLPACRCMDNVAHTEPWLSMLLELVSLDVFADATLSEIFSDCFLDKYLSRDYNKLDLLQLLRLHQAVKCLHPGYNGIWPSPHYLREAKAINGANVSETPLRGALELEFGPKCVLTRCKTDLGIFIDHVVVIQPNGKPQEFIEDINSDDFIRVEKLPIASDCQRVAISLLSPYNLNSLNQLKATSVLSSRVLETCGFIPVNVVESTWRSMPDWEKLPYLKQQIKLSCNFLSDDLEKNRS